MQTRRVSLRIQGEVVQNNDDGSTRVRTDRGDLDIRLPRDQPRPERGQRVEIEIHPGRSPDRLPETVTIREQPAAPSRPTSTPVEVSVRSPEEQTQTQTQAQAQARQALPVEIRHPRPSADAGRQTLPPEGSVVRLQPLPARIVQTLPAPDIISQTLNNITQSVIFEASLIASQPAGQIQNTVLNIQTPPPPQGAPVALPMVTDPSIQLSAQGSQQSLSKALQTALLFQTPLFQTPQITGASFETMTQPTLASILSSPLADTPKVPVLQAIQNLRAPSSFITTPTNINPTILPVTSQIPEHLSIKPQAHDVVIEKITPPNITITPAGTTPDIRPARNIPSTGDIPSTQKVQKGQAVENLILQNQKAVSITGVVTNITSDSLPVLSVFFSQTNNEQFFALQFPSDSITIGTKIQVTPQSMAAPVTPHMSLPQNIPLPVFLAPQPWPALDEVLQILARATPQAAQAAAQAMVNVTPSPANTAQFGPALMFFVAALRGGDLSQWLGDKTAELLKTQKGGSALNRLLNDGATLSRVSSEATPQDWRALNVPLYWGGDMHKIGLYFRHEREEHEGDTHSIKGTRFVFDLALDRMGKVQLDGLFRPATGQLGRLDLVVRTEEHFSQSTRADMRRIYAKALRDTQVTGELSFQNQPESWVRIQADENNQLGVSA